MGLSRAPYFLFYFYLGYWLRTLRKDVGGARGGWLVAGLWFAYFLFLLLHLQATHLYMPGCPFKCPRWLQGCSHFMLHLMTLAHTTCGILALYVSVKRWLLRHRDADAQPGPLLRECSRLCYGVYVLHMFFMQPIYFYSGFPQWCCTTAAGVWLLPWIVLLVTMLLSVAGTWLLLKTRVGRFLIG